MGARPLSDRAAARLVAAGRLLQAPAERGGRGLSITPARGERYPRAVLRAIATLAPADQAHLRELVDWVEDYERHAPVDGAEVRPAPPAP